MRLFYAAFLSGEQREAYAALVTAVRDEVRGSIRPVPAGSHHVTLGFLGETADEDVAACGEMLVRIRTFGAIPITLGFPRVLSGRGKPRLVLVDVDQGADRLEALQRVLQEGLRERLPGLDVRPKPPHVTIARFARGASRGLGARVAEAFARRQAEGPPRMDTVERIDLVRSTLTREGPVYESIAEVPLARLD